MAFERHHVAIIIKSMAVSRRWGVIYHRISRNNGGATYDMELANKQRIIMAKPVNIEAYASQRNNVAETDYYELAA